MEANAEVPVLQVDSISQNDNVDITPKSERDIECERDNLLVEEYISLLNEAAKERSVSFSFDTTTIEHDFLGLLHHPDLLYSKHYKGITKELPSFYNVTISYYIFKNSYIGNEIINNHCDEYYAAVRKGKETEFLMETPYCKMPIFVFGRYSTVFIIESTNGIKHISDAAIGELCDIYKISNNDVIPCQREYIEPKLAAKIKPVLSDWLKFYDLDITQFYKTKSYSSDRRSVPVRDWKYEPDSASIHLREYDKKYHDVYNPILYDYSPNKKYYLNLLETSGVYQSEDGTWSYEGGDDCQEIYLTNRQDKWTNLHLWLGASSFAEGVFWIDNDSFIIVYWNYSDDSFVIDIYGKLSGVYSCKVKESPKESYFGYNLKKRGIKAYD